MAYQQWQQTPQGLHQLFSNDLPQAAQPAAMGLLAQQQRADAVSEADQLRQFNFDNAADPIDFLH
jgi:hypothetical protein